MPYLEYWLWLSAAPVGFKAKAQLIKRYGDAETAFFAPDGEYARIDGVSAAEAAALERRDMGAAAFIAEECARTGIAIVTQRDAAYPQRLKNIYAPPAVLYVKGTLPDLDANAPIAVIGTRSASPYGLKMGRDMAWQIARCGGLVVSMLTNGVDAAAAKGALLAGCKCIAVLGTPHECEPGRLPLDIAASGALISEYPPGTKPLKSFFRDRNRIAAGISVGVVVVEAPEKSGTRLFAAEAAEQGKEIFAVPGNVDSENSSGTNALLKEGARIALCGADVMSEFEALYPDKIKISHQTRAPEEKSEPARDFPAVSAKKDIDKENGRGYIDLKAQLSSLTEEQLQIITAIGKNAVHIDDIIDATGLGTAKVLAQLTVLEIKGFVRREAGKRITLNTAKK